MTTKPIHDTRCILCHSCYLTFTLDTHKTTIVCESCLSQPTDQSSNRETDQSSNHDDAPASSQS